ncbi:hypothetical protein [Thalassomonas haliotis]|uniref:Uncharacterized protein n=1 Tax=Thalassomonas haliotis TaxID=485448 RepID=A0ABY7VBM9_9GAMM|nr:hypothetical protein [Thalassomonas haliotis]WDE10645.1 hypothetical protein H3N35_20655 [Thalassomonas haliotis]
MYTDDSDLCIDLEKDDCEFTVIFKNKTELTEADRALLTCLLEKVVVLDTFVANRMSSSDDYEFELSYVEIGKSVLFSYCGINVNSTWEFEFNAIQEGESYNFKSRFEK